MFSLDVIGVDGAAKAELNSGKRQVAANAREMNCLLKMICMRRMKWTDNFRSKNYM
jgi:hypothetical protein